MSDGTNSRYTEDYLGAGGAVLVVMGAFLPWATSQAGSRAGLSSPDGILTLVIGVAVIGILVFKSFSERWVGVAGVVCTVVGAYDILNPLEIEMLGVAVMSSFIQPGIGVHLTAFGGLAMIASVAVHYNAR